MSLLLPRSSGRTAAVAFRSRPLPPRLRTSKPPSTFAQQRRSLSKSTNQSAKPASDASTSAGTSIPVPNTVANLPLWQRLGPLSRFFEFYARRQRRAPLRTQFASSLVIYFLGDLSAQSISGDAYDPKRTARALCIGAGSSIPSYKWFMFLGNHFNYSSTILSLITKVVVNQAVFTPLFNTYFFGMQSFLSQLQTLPLNQISLQATWSHIKRTVPTSCINSCKLWPAVTAFSFSFIGPQYRSIFAGVIAIGWQTYLSYLNKTAEGIERELKRLAMRETVVGVDAKELIALENEATGPASKAKERKALV